MHTLKYSNIPYSAAMGGVGGAPVGASPVPGGNIGLALAGGGTSLVANEGKAGGWEPSRKFTVPSMFLLEIVTRRIL